MNAHRLLFLGFIVLTLQANGQYEAANWPLTYHQLMLDLSYLPNGVYWVSVVVDGERVTKEVVKAGP